MCRMPKPSPDFGGGRLLAGAVVRRLLLGMEVVAQVVLRGAVRWLVHTSR